MLNQIDRLEALVTDGKRIPLTGRTLIDEREFLDIIDQFRVSLPEELRQARRTNQERERLLAEARAEAERVASAAQERAAFLLQDDELAKAAERRAEMIEEEAQQHAAEIIEDARQQADALLADAQRQAEEVRSGAEFYAREVLGTLDQELERHRTMIRKGLAMLDGHLSDTNVG